MLIGTTWISATAPSHPLRSDYVESCWTPLLGAAPVALLRLCPVLWAECVPAVIDETELAYRIGCGPRARVRSIAKRLAAFGLARWDPENGVLNVSGTVPELSEAQLTHATDWVRHCHAVLSQSADH